MLLDLKPADDQQLTLHLCDEVLSVFQDEDEVDQGTMVRAGTKDSGTIRAAGSLAGSLSVTARTMISHDDDDEDTGTMRSQLGTMVINSDDEDEEEAGTMKSKISESCVEMRNTNVITTGKRLAVY